MIPLLQNHPFCRFSDQIRQQAEGALRTLKNRHELNSDMVLYCYWFAANSQGLLSKTNIKRLLAAVYSWHQKIVEPLNTLCNQLNESIALNVWSLEDSAYESALNTLLAAEQVEQLLMAEVLPKKPRRGRAFLAQTSTHACLNVSTYCQTVYVTLEEADYECLAEIMNAVFNEMDPTKTLSFIRKTLANRQNKAPLQKDLLLAESDINFIS